MEAPKSINYSSPFLSLKIKLSGLMSIWKIFYLCILLTVFSILVIIVKHLLGDQKAFPPIQLSIILLKSVNPQSIIIQHSYLISSSY